MGAQILIRLESDKYDERNLSPFLGRDFHWEITKGRLWKDINCYFLSQTESSLLEAPFDETLQDCFGEPINPKPLVRVFEKVMDFLKSRSDILPFEIFIDYDKMKALGLDYPLVINKSKCWIQGDSNLYKVNNKVRIVNLPNEPNEIDLWVPLDSKITIENRVYFLKKETRFEKFEGVINEVINFCKYAIEENEKVYWIYSH